MRKSIQRYLAKGTVVGLSVILLRSNIVSENLVGASEEIFITEYETEILTEAVTIEEETTGETSGERLSEVSELESLPEEITEEWSIEETLSEEMEAIEESAETISEEVTVAIESSAEIADGETDINETGTQEILVEEAIKGLSEQNIALEEDNEKQEYFVKELEEKEYLSEMLVYGGYTDLYSPTPSGSYWRSANTDSGSLGTLYCSHDINGVTTGTPVYAIADGTVTFRQTYYTNSSGVKKLISYGNTIIFTSSDNSVKALYAHLDSFVNVSLTVPSSQTAQLSSSNVSNKQTITLASRSVSVGEVIGYIGQTGNATGPHLHFELAINGTRVNPPDYLTLGNMYSHPTEITCNCSELYAGTYNCTSNTTLKIRSGHGTGYASLGTIPSGAQVSVSKGDGSWAHVSYNGINGYASMQYLSRCQDSYADYGDNFYAHIIQSSEWKHLESRDNNVQVALNGNSTDTRQIWHFVRNSDGSYKISNEYNGYFLDADAASTANGTNIQTWPDDTDANNQKWYLIDTGGGIVIASAMDTSAVMDITGGYINNGDNVAIWERNDTPAQLFNVYKVTNYTKPERPDKSVLTAVPDHVNGSVSFSWTESPLKSDRDSRVYDLRIWKGTDTSADSVFCEYAISGTVRNNIELTPGVYTANITSSNVSYYEWYTWGDYITFEIYNYANFGDDFYAYIIQNTVWKPLESRDNNVQVVLDGTDGKDTRLVWHFVRNSDGSYKISNEYNGYILDADDGGTENGTNIITYAEDHGGNNQKWYLIDTYRGIVIASAMNTLAVMDVTGGYTDGGTNVQIWERNDTAAQLFDVYKLTNDGVTYIKPELPDKSVLTAIPDHVNRSVSFSWTESPLKSDCYDSRMYDLRIWKGTDTSADFVFYESISGTSKSNIELEAGVYTANITSVNTSYHLWYTWGDDIRFKICQFDYAVSEAPTISDTGILKMLCSDCGAEDAIVLPKLNREDYSYTVIKEATYTSTGTARYTWKATSYGIFYFEVTLDKLAADSDIPVTEGFKITDITATAYNKLKISWTKAEGADGYIVYRLNPSTGTYTVLKNITDADTLSYINSVISGVSYTYKVSPYKLDGTDKVYLAESEPVSGKALPAAPKLESVNMAAYNKIRIIWEKVSGCEGYVIYRSTAEDGNYSVLKTVTQATATNYVNVVRESTTFYYKLRAFVTVDGKKVYGDYSEILSGNVISGAPSGLTAEQKSSGKVTFAWDKVADADGYVVYIYYAETGKYKALKNVTDVGTLTYTKKMTPSETDQFAVRSYRLIDGKKIYSDYSELVEVK